MLALTRVALIRLVRDRTNVFFVVLFPVLLVLLLGSQFGGQSVVALGVVGGATDVGTALVSRLDPATFEVVPFDDETAARRAVETGDVAAAALVRSLPDDRVEVAFVANPDGSDLALRARVAATVAAIDGQRRAAEVLVAEGLVIDGAAARAAIDGLGDVGPDIVTTAVGAGGLDAEFAGLGQFDLGASSQLLLFVFITALTGSATIIQARRWRILDRVLAGPTSPSAVVLGLGLGQLVVALLQAFVIVAATAALFEVDWGDPVATAAVVVVFATVSAAAGLLLGAVLDNEEQAGGIGVPLALVLAALGGSMVPLELFPDVLVPVSRITPHAWGNLALAEIMRRDAGVLDVLPQLGVLVGFAVVLGAAASWSLRRRLATG